MENFSINIKYWENRIDNYSSTICGLYRMLR